MQHRLRLACAAALIALAPAAATANCAAPENLAQVRAEIGNALNAQRDAKGQRRLMANARLDQAAMAHACWMAETNTFSHRGAGSSLPKQRIKATGYKTRLTAENLAYGQTTTAQVIAEWMNSPGHRKNILLGGIDEYGLGVAVMNGRLVWVLDVAAK